MSRPLLVRAQWPQWHSHCKGRERPRQACPQSIIDGNYVMLVGQMQRCQVHLCQSFACCFVLVDLGNEHHPDVFLIHCRAQCLEFQKMWGKKSGHAESNRMGGSRRRIRSKYATSELHTHGCPKQEFTQSKSHPHHPLCPEPTPAPPPIHPLTNLIPDASTRIESPYPTLLNYGLLFSPGLLAN